MTEQVLVLSFRDSAQKPETYRYDIEHEVVDFYRAYPELKGKFFFFDVKEVSLILPGDASGDSGMDKPDIIRIPVNDRMEQALSEKGIIYDGLSYESVIGMIAYSRTKKTSSSNIVDGCGYVFLNPDAGRQGLPRPLGQMYATDMEKAFATDHEEGHAICLYGYDPRNLGECVADAYATIRHIQRFGADSACIRNIVDTRAVELVFRDDSGEHFTSPVTEKIIADSKIFDFSSLTPEETKRMASRYALKYAMNENLVRSMFGAFKGRLPEIAKGDYAALRELGNHVLSTDAAADFRWGAVALRALLDGKVICDGVRIAPAGDEWREMRKALDRRQAEYEACGPLLFGLAPQILSMRA